MCTWCWGELCCFRYYVYFFFPVPVVSSSRCDAAAFCVNTVWRHIENALLHYYWSRTYWKCVTCKLHMKYEWWCTHSRCEIMHQSQCSTLRVGGVGVVYRGSCVKTENVGYISYELCYMCIGTLLTNLTCGNYEFPLWKLINFLINIL